MFATTSLDPRVQAFRSSIIQAVQSAQYQATEGELADLYRLSEMSYIASNFWAQNVGGADFQLLDPTGEPLALPTPNEPVKRQLTLYERMILQMIRSAQFRRTMYNLEMSYRFFGRALGVKLYNVNNLLKGIEYINPQWYRPYVDTTRHKLIGFSFAQRVEELHDVGYLVPVDRCFYYTGFSFDDDFDGVSSAEVAFLHGMAGSDLAKMSRSIFQNMAIPALVIQPEEGNQQLKFESIRGPNDEVIEAGDESAFEEFFGAKIKGASNAGATILLKERYTFQELNNPALREMDTGAQRDNFNHAVALAFHVNYEFFEPGLTNYAELKGKMKIWGQWQYLPHMRDYCDNLTEQLVQPYLPNYTVSIDETSYQYADETEKQGAIDTQYKNGFIDLATAARQSGVENPPQWQIGAYYVDGVGVVPETEVANIWRLKIGAPPPTAAPVAGQPMATTSSPIVEPTPTKDMPSLFVGLSLADNPDILGLQTEVKSLNTDAGCKWSAPDSFHITLLSAPSVDAAKAQAFITALKGVEVPDLRLRVGSLGSFDAVGKHSMHFNVRSNAALYEYQEKVFELAQQHGVATSSYSDPDAYKPHITVGYSPAHMNRTTYRGGLSVVPRGVFVSYGDNGSMWQSWQVEEEDKDENAPPSAAKTSDPIPLAPDVFSELRRLVDRARKGKDFTPDKIPVAVALRAYHMVEVERQMTGREVSRATDDNRFAALWAYYDQLATGTKAIQATRLDYEHSVEDLLSLALRGKVDRRNFARRMTFLLRTYGQLAFEDGLKDSGVDAELSPEDMSKITTLAESQKAYVTSLVNQIYKDDKVTPDEITGRAVMWFNMSVYPFYTAGIESGSTNGVFEWVLGNREEHCASCKLLAGQRRRWSFWRLTVMPKDRRLSCHGFLCGCTLVPTSLAVSRGKLPAWQIVGAKSDDLHEHEEGDEETMQELPNWVITIAADATRPDDDYTTPATRRFEIKIIREEVAA